MACSSSKSTLIWLSNFSNAFFFFGLSQTLDEPSCLLNSLYWVLSDGVVSAFSWAKISRILCWISVSDKFSLIAACSKGARFTSSFTLAIARALVYSIDPFCSASLISSGRLSNGRRLVRKDSAESLPTEENTPSIMAISSLAIRLSAFLFLFWRITLSAFSPSSFSCWRITLSAFLSSEGWITSSRVLLSFFSFGG